jgi:hypothetical protein
MPEAMRLPGGHLLEPHIMLYVDGVTKTFDGFRASTPSRSCWRKGS